MNVAIPVTRGRLCPHFGHCETIAIFKVENGAVLGREDMTPPAHAPGVFPRFLHKLDVAVILAGGMGKKALELFDEFGIKVVTGTVAMPPEAAVRQFIDGTLPAAANVCDH